MAAETPGESPVLVHSSLSPLLHLSEVTGRPICFIPERVKHLHPWYRWLPKGILQQLAAMQLHHLVLAWRVLREKQPGIFFLFEHKPLYAWPLYLALLLKGRPCFFIVHGMQQAASRSKVYRVGLFICQCWSRLGEFYPIHLELGDQALPAALRFDPAKSLVIPHGHPLAETIRPAPMRTGLPRVGLVGMLRRDKPIAKLLDLLLPGSQRGEYELIIGTPAWQNARWLDEMPVTQRDTGSDEAYSACLDEIDLLVADFLKEDYEFRPSGVVIDAAMHDCFVLAPGFSVIQEEIEQPVPIGATYSSIEEVPELVREHARHLRESPPDFASWRAYRSMRAIGPRFTAFLEKREAIKGRALP